MSSNKDVGVIDREWIEFHVGRSNTIILTENEAQVAKEFLGEVQGNLDRIDLEIARIYAVIDDLKAQREVLLAQANRIRTAMAPHKRFPSELLSAIFIDTLDSGRTSLVLGNPRESWPWPLRAVCSRWRDVAISDIRLWESVTCRLQGWDERVGERLSMALQSITASCKLPPARLEIDIGESTDLSHEHYSQFQPRHLSSFPPLPTPITGLNLSLPLRWQTEFFHFSASELPSLESLSLDFQQGGEQDYYLEYNALSTFYYATFFDEAHHLRKLSIQSFISLQQIHAHPRIPWNQLTELDFYEMALAAIPILEVLKQCGRLESCRLWVEHGEHQFPTLESIGSENITLAHLRSLTVGGKISQGNRFFARLLVPLLDELCLTMQYRHAFADVSTMLRTSGTSLEIFEYDSNMATHLPEELELEDLLKSFPCLVELNSSLKFPSSTLERVSQGELLPRVEVLNCIVGTDELDAFFSMLINRRSRPGSSCGLRKVWITFTEDAKESGEERSQSISDKYGITRV